MAQQFFCWSCGKYKDVSCKVQRKNGRSICVACKKKAKAASTKSGASIPPRKGEA